MCCHTMLPRRRDLTIGALLMRLALSEFARVHACMILHASNGRMFSGVRSSESSTVRL